MKKIGVLAFSLALVALAAWLAVDRGLARSAETTALDLPTAAVGRMEIGSTVLATGVIRPQVGAEVAVGSRVSGVLQRLHVTVGDRVRQGQMLAELDPTEFEARHQQALASLETARVDRDFARQQFGRAEGLIRERVIAQTEFDDAERLLRTSEARLRETEATLRSAEIQLGYTKIRAPISGVVASVSTQVGETVAASFAAPTFLTIIDLERLEVWAYVDETDIGRVEVDQQAVFTVDTYPSTEFSGVVTAIRPAAEIQNNVVNYITVLEIGDIGDRVLRPEMTTTVNIHLEGRGSALAVPNDAVKSDDGGAYVLIRAPEGSIRKGIRTGYRGRTHTEVVEGLEEGDVVLLGDIGTAE
jgi:macrolide-specific efflux system membrane fusion protein